MSLSFTPLASQDLEAIADYIAQDNPYRALSFVGEIREQCQKIAGRPLMYSSRPELGPEIRACPFGRYLIIFKPEPENATLIVRVLHGAMDIASKTI